MSHQMSSPKSPSHRHAEPQFVIYAANLPRSLTTGDWRPFKDFIRSHIGGQPGWVTGEPRRNAAWVNLRNAVDARQAWDALTAHPVRGRALEIKLFKIDSGECRIVRSTEVGINDLGEDSVKKMLRSLGLDPSDENGYTSTPVRTRATVSPVLSPAFSPVVSPTSIAASVAPISNSYYPSSAIYQSPGSLLHEGYGGMYSGYSITAQQLPIQGQYPVQSAYEAQPSVHPQPGYQSQHIYQQNQYNLPVNVGQSSVEVVRRSLFIRKLPKDVTEHEIRRLLQQRNLTGFGEISIIMDPKTNKGKGQATVKLASAEKVEEAVEKLNDLRYKESKLIVREAREATPVAPPDPYMVVNGST